MHALGVNLLLHFLLAVDVSEGRDDKLITGVLDEQKGKIVVLISLAFLFTRSGK